MADVEVRVCVLFFAKSRELTGLRESNLCLPQEATFQQILQKLVDAFPSLTVIAESILLSLNQEYITEDSGYMHLQVGDEIAVIPPISGG